jgi:hypothetical protein
MTVAMYDTGSSGVASTSAKSDADSGAVADASSLSTGVIGGTIAHGQEINASNVGYGAYYDSGLGRYLLLSDLTTVTGPKWASDYASAGGTISKRRFTSDVRIDIPVTFVGCLFQSFVTTLKNGVQTGGAVFNYCSWNPTSQMDECLQFGGYTAYRCLLQGGSDGAKTNGAIGGYPTILRECYIRCYRWALDDPATPEDEGDHNDAVQNVGGAGNVYIERCNIDGRNTRNGEGVAIFSADGVNGTTYIHDCLLAGAYSGRIIALHEWGTYDVQGNKFVRPPAGTPVVTVEGGITWANVNWGTVRPNTYQDNGAVIPSGG